MRKVQNLIPLIFLFVFAGQSMAQQPVNGQINPELLTNPWSAFWIGGPAPAGGGQRGQGGGGFGAPAPPPEFAVYHFRKSIDLTAKPATFVVHVSADNRYKLYVNGVQVSHGPAASSPKYWNFETVDIAPYLKQGKNTIASIVWHAANFAPVVQMSGGRAGFILQGNTDTEKIVNTNNTWKVFKSTAYKPVRANGQALGYIAIGYTEQVDFNTHPTGWELTDFEDASWSTASQITAGATLKGTANGGMGFNSPWTLQPSILPAMEMKVQRLAILRLDSAAKVPKEFPAAAKAFTIPANSKAKILLDQGVLTNAYPVLKFSKGKNATIAIGYAETLYNPPAPPPAAAPAGGRGGQMTKGNRNDIQGKRFVGFKDQIISGGKDNEEYTSLWYRTYRYVQFEITTSDEPLTIQDFYGVFTGYPFELKSKFNAGLPELDKILEVGYRTARLSAVDTYMDCPYYERLQYVGDARIQALVSLYNTGDDRLMRQLISQVDHSRNAEGLTYSRYPDNLSQYIPMYSLSWINIVHDFWWYRPDANVIKESLPGMRQILNYFSGFQKPDGTIEGLPGWKFSDWVYGSPGWASGNPPLINNGNSSVLDLQLLGAYQDAADLENAYGSKDLGKQYQEKADQLQATIKSKYWSAEKNLFADDPRKEFYSQHANILAVLYDVIKGDEASKVMSTVLKEATLAPASIYFKYYLHLAGNKAGFGDQYIDWLGVWRDHLSSGLSTWGEVTDANTTRSDSHAWGSSPNIEFYRIVLGIDSDAPGFSKVKIEPHLGQLKKVSGEMPHPNGKISASYTQEKNNTWTVEINLPEKTTGYMLWKNKRYELLSGKNSLKL
jgi:alpha-L-rhamnosidase